MDRHFSFTVQQDTQERDKRRFGYNNNFVIYDDDDQSNLIRHILKEFKIYEAMYRGVVSRISSLKSSLVSPATSCHRQMVLALMKNSQRSR